MSCPEANEMAAFLDGVMMGAEEARWRMHFQQCDMCRKAIQELRTLMAYGIILPDESCIERGKALVRGEECVYHA